MALIEAAMPKENSRLQKLKLMQFESISEDANGYGGNARLSDLDYFMVYWICAAVDGTDEAISAADLLKPLIRNTLKNKFEKYRDKIVKLQESERRAIRIRQGTDEGDPPPKKAKH